MSGWTRQQDHWWATIADVIPKPWPRDAGLMDLRFWDSQERAWAATHGERGVKKRPGRGKLAERWGWSDKVSRNVMADVDAWVDPFLGDRRAETLARKCKGPGKVQPWSRSGPGKVQKMDCKWTKSLRTESSEGPGPVQPGSRKSPHARSIDPPDPPLTLDHVEPDGSTPPTEGEPVQWNIPADVKPTPTAERAAIVAAVGAKHRETLGDGFDAEMEALGLDKPIGGFTPTPEPEKQAPPDLPRLGKGVVAKKLTPGHLGVYKAWKDRQPSPGTCRLTKQRVALLTAALADYSTGELTSVIDLAYTAPIAEAALPERFALAWRGESGDGAPGLEMLLRGQHLARNVEMAARWRAGSNPEDSTLIRKSWHHMQHLLTRTTTEPSKLHADDSRHAQLESAVRLLGGWYQTRTLIHRHPESEPPAEWRAAMSGRPVSMAREQA